MGFGERISTGDFAACCEEMVAVKTASSILLLYAGSARRFRRGINRLVDTFLMTDGETRQQQQQQ